MTSDQGMSRGGGVNSTGYFAPDGGGASISQEHTAPEGGVAVSSQGHVAPEGGVSVSSQGHVAPEGRGAVSSQGLYVSRGRSLRVPGIRGAHTATGFQQLVQQRGTRGQPLPRGCLHIPRGHAGGHNGMERGQVGGRSGMLRGHVRSRRQVRSGSQMIRGGDGGTIRAQALPRGPYRILRGIPRGRIVSMSAPETNRRLLASTGNVMPRGRGPRMIRGNLGILRGRSRGHRASGNSLQMARTPRFHGMSRTPTFPGRLKAPVPRGLRAPVRGMQRAPTVPRRLRAPVPGMSRAPTVPGRLRALVPGIQRAPTVSGRLRAQVPGMSRAQTSLERARGQVVPENVSMERQNFVSTSTLAQRGNMVTATVGQRDLMSEAKVGHRVFMSTDTVGQRGFMSEATVGQRGFMSEGTVEKGDMMSAVGPRFMKSRDEWEGMMSNEEGGGMISTEEQGDIFPEERGDMMFTEEQGDNMFTEERGDKMFTEEWDDMMFAEERGYMMRDDIMFAEERGDMMFPEERGDKMFIEELGDMAFPEERGDEMFTGNVEEPGDMSTEERGDMFAEEGGDMMSTEEREDKMFTEERGGMMSKVEQEILDKPESSRENQVYDDLDFTEEPLAMGCTGVMAKIHSMEMNSIQHNDTILVSDDDETDDTIDLSQNDNTDAEIEIVLCPDETLEDMSDKTFAVTNKSPLEFDVGHDVNVNVVKKDKIADIYVAKGDVVTINESNIALDSIEFIIESDQNFNTMKHQPPMLAIKTDHNQSTPTNFISMEEQSDSADQNESHEIIEVQKNASQIEMAPARQDSIGNTSSSLERLATQSIRVDPRSKALLETTAAFGGHLEDDTNSIEEEGIHSLLVLSEGPEIAEHYSKEESAECVSGTVSSYSCGDGDLVDTTKDTDKLNQLPLAFVKIVPLQDYISKETYGTLH